MMALLLRVLLLLLIGGTVLLGGSPAQRIRGKSRYLTWTGQNHRGRTRTDRKQVQSEVKGQRNKVKKRTESKLMGSDPDLQNKTAGGFSCRLSMESVESAGSGSGSGVGPGFCWGPVSSLTRWVWFVSMQTMFWFLTGPRGSVLQNPGPDWREYLKHWPSGLIVASRWRSLTCCSFYSLNRHQDRLHVLMFGLFLDFAKQRCLAWPAGGALDNNVLKTTNLLKAADCNLIVDR